MQEALYRQDLTFDELFAESNVYEGMYRHYSIGFIAPLLFNPTPCKPSPPSPILHVAPTSQ